MDDELKELLEENLEVSKENNKLLKKLWGSVQLGRLFKILYWVIILGIAVGAYYYIQPYIENTLNIYSQINKTASDIQNLPIQPILDNININNSI